MEIERTKIHYAEKTRDCMVWRDRVNKDYDVILVAVDDYLVAGVRHRYQLLSGGTSSHLFVFSIIDNLPPTGYTDAERVFESVTPAAISYFNSTVSTYFIDGIMIRLSKRCDIVIPPIDYKTLITSISPLQEIPIRQESIKSFSLDTWIDGNPVNSYIIDREKAHDLNSSTYVYSHVWSGKVTMNAFLKTHAPGIKETIIAHLVKTRDTLVSDLTLVGSHLKLLKQYH